ncbi:nucleotidyltransferase family protein [Herbaspirillum sp. CAH-3]|uniref:nucleotidyltransferase family protein n=1 Tax=Herbaspirillum sp. CAH-3 TaxID=2605746 RepID=UPI0012AC621D|nr:nucleotidyltransferase family protein [Herbaspirillum sp. CAH-3]
MSVADPLIRRLQQLIAADAHRLHLLRAVRSLALPDAWIGAGFVRNAVWDALHGRPAQVPHSDIDVIWFDPLHSSPEHDAQQEARLAALCPGPQWSVRNQARMHLRNGDAPYANAIDALRYWPETATAVAVRLTEQGGIEVAAPLGLQDLWQGLLRPAGAFAHRKKAQFAARVGERGWLQRWPQLVPVDDEDAIE